MFNMSLGKLQLCFLLTSFSEVEIPRFMEFSEWSWRQCGTVLVPTAADSPWLEHGNRGLVSPPSSIPYPDVGQSYLSWVVLPRDPCNRSAMWATSLKFISLCWRWMPCVCPESNDRQERRCTAHDHPQMVFLSAIFVTCTALGMPRGHPQIVFLSAIFVTCLPKAPGKGERLLRSFLRRNRMCWNAVLTQT